MAHCGRAKGKGFRSRQGRGRLRRGWQGLRGRGWSTRRVIDPRRYGNGSSVGPPGRQVDGRAGGYLVSKCAVAELTGLVTTPASEEEAEQVVGTEEREGWQGRGRQLRRHQRGSPARQQYRAPEESIAQAACWFGGVGGKGG